MSEVVRIGVIIIFHLSKLWKPKFSILCDVIFLERLQGKLEIDQSWDWKGFTQYNIITVWRTWPLIAYSDERWLYYQFLTTSLVHFCLKGWENVLFGLGSERDKTSAPPGSDRSRFPLVLSLTWRRVIAACVFKVLRNPLSNIQFVHL